MSKIPKKDLYLLAHFAKFPRGYIITVFFPGWSANPIKQLTSLTTHFNYLRFPTGYSSQYILNCVYQHSLAVKLVAM